MRCHVDYRSLPDKPDDYLVTKNSNHLGDYSSPGTDVCSRPSAGADLFCCKTYVCNDILFLLLVIVVFINSVLFFYDDMDQIDFAKFTIISFKTNQKWLQIQILESFNINTLHK